METEDTSTDDGQEPPEGPQEAAADQAKSADWYEKELAKTRKEAAKYRTDNKSLAEKAAKLDELEGATKSDLEKLTEKATTFEQRAAEAEAKALRLEIALEKGLSQALMKRLAGSTKEELEADADELLETFGTPKPKGNGRMAENLRPSGGGDEPPEETDPAKLAAAIPRY